MSHFIVFHRIFIGILGVRNFDYDNKFKVPVECHLDIDIGHALINSRESNLSKDSLPKYGTAFLFGNNAFPLNLTLRSLKK